MPCIYRNIYRNKLREVLSQPRPRKNFVNWITIQADKLTYRDVAVSQVGPVKQVYARMDTFSAPTNYITLDLRVGSSWQHYAWIGGPLYQYTPRNELAISPLDTAFVQEEGIKLATDMDDSEAIEWFTQHLERHVDYVYELEVWQD